ncbi:MAG TPA: hypothetical protein VHP33_19715 [Polyangiaceae bacterium]|nr:hypothetical protein [Polyangiaceae bacterium]
MNISLKQVVLRAAAAAGLLVGSSVVACSGTEEPANTPAPTTAGNTGTSGSATTAGTGGTSSAGTSSGGTGGAAKCPGNQIGMPGACMCPAYAPQFCDAITKCVSPMKDPDHCGGCDTKCGATNACAAGACTPDLTTVAEVAGCGTLALVSAAGKLYVLSTMTGSLSSIALPAAAGATPTPIATGLTGGTAFAVDATNAYVATGMTVTAVKLADGTKTTLVTETAKIFDIAVDSGKIYYAVGKDVKEASATAAGAGVSVAVSADEGEAQGVAVSAGTVLYASAAAFNLEMDPVVGEGHVKIGASQAGLIFGHRSVQADATTVYWANGSLQAALFTGADHAGKIVAQPIDGSPIVAYAIDSTAKTAYIATYEAATMDSNLEKSAFDKADQEAIWMARGLPKVSSIVLDDTSVYLSSACKILKSAR